MSEKLGCLVTVLIVVGIGMWLSLSSDKKTAAKNIAEQKAKDDAQAQADALLLQRQEALTTFAARSNAVQEWGEKKAESTADFQENMIRADGRPLLFVAYLQDIIKMEDSYLLFFSPFLVRSFSDPPLIDWQKNIYYWITCDIPQGNRLREQLLSKNYQKDFAVAARISSVERPWFTQQGDSPRMALRTSGKAIIAYGRLVDWMPFPLPPEAPAPPARGPRPKTPAPLRPITPFAPQVP